MSTLPCPKCEKPRGIFGPCPHCHEDKMSKHWFRLLEEEREKVKGLEQKLAEAMKVIEGIRQIEIYDFSNHHAYQTAIRNKIAVFLATEEKLSSEKI